MLKEFKEFAMKGNVVDLAVGFILGGAFGTIVSSLVNDILMPPIGLLLGGVDFSELKYVLEPAAVQGGEEIPEVAINYGLFINNVISFLIVAFAMFMIVKGMNRMYKKKEEAPETVPEPSTEEKLLTEIRDLLAKQA